MNSHIDSGCVECGCSPAPGIDIISLLIQGRLVQCLPYAKGKLVHHSMPTTRDIWHSTMSSIRNSWNSTLDPRQGIVDTALFVQSTTLLVKRRGQLLERQANQPSFTLDLSLRPS